jgi:hypothetical protein
MAGFLDGYACMTDSPTRVKGSSVRGDALLGPGTDIGKRITNATRVCASRRAGIGPPVAHKPLDDSFLTRPSSQRSDKLHRGTRRVHSSFVENHGTY